MLALDSIANSSWNAGWNCDLEDIDNNIYPSDMYGTSYVRCFLNNDGYYAGSVDCTDLTRYVCSDSNPFVSVLSLSDYIIKPKDVYYQAIESTKAQFDNYDNFANDAYEIPITGDFSSFPYYEENTDAYTGWKYDAIWLPSYTEVGSKYDGNDNLQGPGLWALNESERSASSEWWLRSTAGYRTSNLVITIGSNGSSISDGNPSGTRSVRPALHLNLSALQDAGGEDTGVKIVVLPLVIMILSGFGIAFINLKGNKKRAKNTI